MSAEPMDAKTLEALKASIRKWRKNASTTARSEVKMSPSDCALCGLFFEENCRGCPVAAKSGRMTCQGTPYERAEEIYTRVVRLGGRMRGWKAAARAEVAFLESLLPEGETA